MVTGRRLTSTSTEEETAHKIVYLQKSEQNLQLKGKLADVVSLGGNWKFTGSSDTVYVGDNLQFPFKCYEIEIQKTLSGDFDYARLAYSDVSSLGFVADQQKNNYHNNAYLTGFDCGGYTYQPATSGASSQSVGLVVRNSNSGSGADDATAVVVSGGTPQTGGMIVSNDKGGDTITSGSKIYLLTAGPWLSSSLTAATGVGVNYTTSGALTDSSGAGFTVGRIAQTKGSNAYAVLTLNFKTGFRNSV